VTILPADDPRHGTTRGHAAGCRCFGCRKARNDDEARRRKYRQVLGVHRRVPALGTQRRIRALMALGWTGRDISNRCGWASAEATTEITKDRQFVYTATAAKIAGVYEELCMTPGPSLKGLREAARKGWPPPLAWDDIDDPNETPTGWQYVSGDRHADLDDLLDRGVGVSEAARVLGCTVRALERWTERHGRRADYNRLTMRERGAA
jgi:hypothetical protein